MWTSAFCLLATFASFAVQQGEGLQCHVCSSDTDPGCADPFDATRGHNRYLQDCDMTTASRHFYNAQPSCRKVIQTSKVPGSNGATVTGRACWFGEEDPCQRRLMRYNHNVDHCSVCYEDGCNGAATNYVAMLALGASLIVAKYLA